ncbi:MAG: hypothetical protein GH155_06465 [Spirochaeta sp.]|nr:hypothetical protein [Spirochaeta sp.]
MALLALRSVIMKAGIILIGLILILFLSGCVSGPDIVKYSNIDELIEEAAWYVVDILWESYEDLEEGKERTLAVYYFTEGQKVSRLSDYLINGMTTSIANAVNYEDINISIVSRKNLDRILDELTFQSSDLADPDTQLSIGKQLGAGLILTGSITPAEEQDKFNIQLIEVETARVLGGFIMYLEQNGI